MTKTRYKLIIEQHRTNSEHHQSPRNPKKKTLLQPHRHFLSTCRHGWGVASQRFAWSGRRLRPIRYLKLMCSYSYTLSNLLQVCNVSQHLHPKWPKCRDMNKYYIYIYIYTTYMYIYIYTYAIYTYMYNVHHISYGHANQYPQFTHDIYSNLLVYSVILTRFTNVYTN